MTPETLHDRFRSDVVDTDAPFLWSDDEIYDYMNAAQEMFCRNTYGIADATSSMTSVPIVAGEAYSDVDERLLKVRGAQRASDGVGVDIVNYEDLMKQKYTDYGKRASRVILDNKTGPVQYAVVGLEDHKFRWVQVPEVDDTLEMVIYRLPAVITEDSIEFEIDDIHHLSLLFWMKHLAFSKQDAETFDRNKADANAAEFVAYCRKSKEDQERRKHKPRLMGYGGI